MLHLSLGNKKSYDTWQEFFREMLSGGLRVPMLIISDRVPELKKAIDNCFIESLRQRCITHKLRNISNKLIEEGRRELMPLIKDVYYQTDYDTAKLTAGKLTEKFLPVYPSAAKCIQEDLESCLNHMKFPSGHHRYIRTTNLLERAFAEQKRRTKVIPRFFSEKSCMKLDFGTMIRISDKWRDLKMSDYDLKLLRNIRALLGWNKSKDSNDNEFISKKYAA